MTMDKNQKRCCGFCVGLIVIGVVWFVAFQMPYWDTHQYEDNYEVNMGVRSVYASIVVWPNGQASVTQIMNFRMDPYTYFGLYGIYWPTREGDGAEGHLAKDVVSTLTKSGETRALNPYIDEGGAKIILNGIDLEGGYNDNYDFSITTTYTTKNAICHVDPEDGRVKFAFIPPTFSQSSISYADYYYDIVFTNIPLNSSEYTVPDYGITQAAADYHGYIDVAGTFGSGAWIKIGGGLFAINLTNAKTMEGAAISPNQEFFGVSVYRKMYKSDTNKFISFKLAPNDFSIPKELEDNTPADYWSLEEQGLLVWGVGIAILVAIVALSGYVAKGVKSLGHKAKLAAIERARRRKEKAEIKRLAAELEADGYTVPPESRKSYTFLRALSETIYTEEYKELLARGEVKKVDLLQDWDQDGDVDEDDLTFILGSKLQEIYERDILEELDKAGLLD